MHNNFPPSTAINYIESPINEVSNEIIQQKLHSNHHIEPPTEINRFKQISQRLENNIKKIQSIEHQYENSQQGFNFKSLKNHLLNGSYKKYTTQKEKTQNQSSPPNHQNQMRNGGRIDSEQSQRRQLNFDPESRERKRSISSSKKLTLEACLKEIGKLKTNVQELKQSCQHKESRENRSKVSSYRGDPYQTAKKGSAGSSSKLKYTNYRDLSQRKSNSSQDRFPFSQKKFKWVKNVQPQQFTIVTENQTIPQHFY